VDSKKAQKPQMSGKNNKNKKNAAQDKELMSQTIYRCACLK